MTVRQFTFLKTRCGLFARNVPIALVVSPTRHGYPQI